MYFPKLIDLVSLDPSIYNSNMISLLDDFLGNFDVRSTFTVSGFNFYLADLTVSERILNDLVSIELIQKENNEAHYEDYEEDKFEESYIVLKAPNKKIDQNYIDYISNKRRIDSFGIIYQKTKTQHSGALTLIDLKGYSKNVNNKNNNAAILLLIDKIQEYIDGCIRQYFLNSYSGIEIKHNGDGWFLYFLKEDEAHDFLEDFIIKCSNDEMVKRQFQVLGTSLKCYIHHAEEIEKIYKVDTLHFDMEGKDVILIHMLEKPIEKELYNGIIPHTSNFLAITGSVYNKIGDRASSFKELKDVKIDIRDSEGNLKVGDASIKIYYREFLNN
ncbi:hypothetical protein [Pedobacter sp. Leaf250]|uniref:hypothetical protein n=1 Tax=Pedobacter sp. Leaf250 TaxID=2876559 RepID=UPI001E33F82B|nr:hypothetical protein [Pedobacter sp. Leaf250]